MSELNAPVGMTEYEAARWNFIQAWRDRKQRTMLERLPERVQQGAKRAGELAGDTWDKIPGNDLVEKALADSIKGAFHMAIDLTESTINEKKIVRKVTKYTDVEAESFSDIRGLDLALLDTAAPKNAKKRALMAAGHGAAAGLVAGGAAVAGAASGGMGALPAAGVVALAIVADTAPVSVGSVQASAYVGAHYGFDPSQPAEQAMMMGLLGGALAADAAKAQAFRQIRQLALDLAAKRTVAQLNEQVIYRLMLKLYGSLMLDTAKRSIAKGLPVLGAGIGAGTNYQSVRRTVVAAQHAYPEQWLLDKYATLDVEVLDVEAVTRTVDDVIHGEDAGVIDRLEFSDDESV